MPNNVRYRSGNHSLLVPVGPIIPDTPLMPDLNSVLLFHQRFMQLSSAYVAPPYNQINLDILGDFAYCCGDGPKTELSGQMMTWERVWARVPLSYEKAGGIYNYTFPSLASGRANPLVWPVRVTVVRDFFLCGDNGAFTQWQDIPINRGFYVYDDGDPTEVVTEVSDTTTPTEAKYLAMVNAGTPILLEDSKVYPVFGSIYVRDELYAPAI